MRTLKLSHEEISIIQRALGIAENEFFNLRKKYLGAVVNIRGVDSSLARAEADLMMEKENEFCDLLMDIKNGDKDV